MKTRQAAEIVRSLADGRHPFTQVALSLDHLCQHPEVVRALNVAARLLEAERIREQTRGYLDRYGWDVCEDDEAWREYQRRRTKEEYGDDDW